jgi:dephospho-CoA kinase
MGAGKSTALDALERLGASVLSTDRVVHELYDSPEVIREVVNRFGPEVAPGGHVDRGALAQMAFASPEGRHWLEGLLWPRVGARIEQWRRQVEESDPRPEAAVVEVPLLFESGMGEAFDATIAVIANDELRARRTADRGHQALDERAARQLSQEEKAVRATYLVVNDGSEEELLENLSGILEMLHHP